MVRKELETVVKEADHTEIGRMKILAMSFQTRAIRAVVVEEIQILQAGSQKSRLFHAKTIHVIQC